MYLLPSSTDVGNMLAYSSSSSQKQIAREAKKRALYNQESFVFYDLEKWLHLLTSAQGEEEKGCKIGKGFQIKEGT